MLKIDDNTIPDDDKISTVITVEPAPESAAAPPINNTSYLYLVEGKGVTIDQTGRSAKFSVNTGDGLKIDEDGNKLTADTIGLTVNNGKVGDINNDGDKKLVNAGDLKTALNELGWRLTDGTNTSTVKSGEEVEFKGEGGVTVTATTDTNGKHVVTIKAEQPQGGDAGKSAFDSWKEANNKPNATEEEFLAALKGDKVNVEAKDNTAEVAPADDGKTYKVAVKVADDKGLEKTDNGLIVKAGTGVTVNESGVSVYAKDKGGLTVNRDGVSVTTDNVTIKVDDQGKVSAVTGTITAGESPSVVTADENKLAKAGNVAKAINAVKTNVVAGSGIKVTPSGNEYTVSADLPFTKNADKSISVNEEGVIRNVANGRVAKDSKDAVNGSQLHAVERRLSGNMDKLNHRIDKVGKRADAGTASAIATANLLQSYRPGLSAATAAVGQYRGQSAVAVGYSRLSDNGKYGVKLSLGANTQGNVGAGAGVAYFW